MPKGKVANESQQLGDSKKKKYLKAVETIDVYFSKKPHALIMEIALFYHYPLFMMNLFDLTNQTKTSAKNEIIANGHDSQIADFINNVYRPENESSAESPYTLEYVDYKTILAVWNFTEKFDKIALLSFSQWLSTTQDCKRNKTASCECFGYFFVPAYSNVKETLHRRDFNDQNALISKLKQVDGNAQCI
ncbi:MAG: hypothetical protein EXX96DRAFT_606706 [Benjaminiella poitrasii]|nr:MAG: hypothetical protein EXX96DRAFT_606706 [Benjaminiella poitrasii]